ncbi:zinc metalloprotease HtpX [Candidatus Woesearchaeota archaeon]|nr:zinc metalloprotease HtpX [Candidatus Woesearchaeota archaeon]
MKKKLVNFDEIRNNNIKSIILFIVFLTIIIGLGAIIGLVWGNIYFGLIIATIFGITYSVIAYYSGRKMLVSFANAKEVTKKEEPYLYHTVEGLALAAGIPTPKAYIIEDSAPNAFATGRNPENSAIIVTRGLLQKLNRQELEGVIAHEMSHIKNYDIRSMMIAAVMVGVIVLLSDFLLRTFLWGGGRNRSDKGNAQLIFILIGIALAILSPIIGKLIQLSISRKREYSADAGGAILTRYPEGLASALEKISKDTAVLKSQNNAMAHLYISNPSKKKTGMMTKLFSTHPPTEERIKRLRAM